MWRVNWVVELTDKIQSRVFASKDECLDFLNGHGLCGAFLTEDCMWWITTPEGDIHLRQNCTLCSFERT